MSAILLTTSDQSVTPSEKLLPSTPLRLTALFTQSFLLFSDAYAFDGAPIRYPEVIYIVLFIFFLVAASAMFTVLLLIGLVQRGLMDSYIAWAHCCAILAYTSPVIVAPLVVPSAFAALFLLLPLLIVPHLIILLRRGTRK